MTLPQGISRVNDAVVSTSSAPEVIYSGIGTTNAGALCITTDAPVFFPNGIPTNDVGAVCITTSPTLPTTISNGMRFDATGRLVVTSTLGSPSFAVGGMTFDVNGNLFASGVDSSTILFVFTGESNSGGVASNANLTVSEAATRNVVKIWNVGAGAFQSLLLGTNNNLDHAGLNSTTHGIENQIANTIDAGRLSTQPVYLVQTGQGGSVIANWATGDASGYWAAFLSRYAAATAALNAASVSYSKVVYYSQGIYDIGITTPLATWKAATIVHLNKIIALIGSDVKIAMTKWPGQPTYNTAVDEIAASISQVTAIGSEESGASVEWDGSAHWTYSGYKVIGEKVIDVALSANGAATTPMASPTPGPTDSLSVTLASPTGGIRYSTNGTDPVIGTTYSTVITAVAGETIRARSTTTNKANSTVLSARYTTRSVWSLADAAAVGFNLTNADTTAAGINPEWKTIRGVVGASSGKLYAEIVNNISISSGGFMAALVNAGASSATFPGNSNHGVGFFSAGGSQIMSSGFTAGSGAVPATSLPTAGYVLALAVDFSTGEIWIAENNSWLGGGNPAAGTNPAVTATLTTTGALFPALGAQAPGSGLWRIKLYSADLTYSPPIGFTSWIP